MDKFTKEYPEFGYKVEYEIRREAGMISWSVEDPNGDKLMDGMFKSENHYQSNFTIFPSYIEENIYENLFYLYFENIKLTCIELMEDENVEDIEELNENL